VRKDTAMDSNAEVKGVQYFIENPEELTVEDIARIKEGGGNILNNFHLHVRNRDDTLYTELSLSAEYKREIAALKCQIKEAVEEEKFDSQGLEKAWSESARLTDEAVAIARAALGSPPYKITAEQQTRIEALQAEVKRMRQQHLPALLSLYKNLRRRGVPHITLVQ